MTSPKRNTVNITFFAIYTLTALIGGAYYIYSHGITWLDITLFLSMTILTLMSISAGYHRLYAHRTHDTASWLKFCYLIFGAAAFEQSCLKWATEHRMHHRFVDTDKDPYNIKKGFYWAHIGWILHEDPARIEPPADLLEDKLVVWQHKYWVAIAGLASFALPAAIGALFGNALGGFLFGGVIRLAFCHHATFSINSLAHTIGGQTYSDKCTARDSWITALFTFGEGYHNFHHWSPGDYRNGVRRYHWDPPKWWIRAMDALGQAWNVKRMPEEAIVRARLEMQRQHAEERKGAHPKMTEMYEHLVAQVEDLGRRRRQWMEMKRATSAHALKLEVELLQARFEEAKVAYQESYKAWKRFLRTRTATAQ